MVEKPEVATSTSAEQYFEWPPQEPVVQLCTSNQCSGGHVWPAKLALVDCPGCAAPVLLVLMEQCPQCNEPTQTFRMRTDHIMKGGGYTAQCKGQKNAAEVTEICMERQHAQQIAVEALTPAAEHGIRIGGTVPGGTAVDKQ